MPNLPPLPEGAVLLSSGASAPASPPPAPTPSAGLPPLPDGAVLVSSGSPSAPAQASSPGLLDRLSAGFSRGTQDLADTVDTIDSDVPALNAIDRLVGGGSSPAVLAKDAAGRQTYAARYGDSTAASIGRFAGQTAASLPLMVATDGAASAVAGRALPALLQGVARGTTAGAVQGAATASGDGQTIGQGALDGAAVGGALAGGLSAPAIASAGARAAGRAILDRYSTSTAARLDPAVLTDTDAAQSVLRVNALRDQIAAGAPTKVTPQQASTAAIGTLKSNLNDHVSALADSGAINDDQATTARRAIAAAANSKSTISTADNEDFAATSALDLPGHLATPLTNGLQDLNRLSASRDRFYNAGAGPVSAMLGKAAPIVGAVAPIVAGQAGLGVVPELALEAAGVGGGLSGAAGAFGRRIGQGFDRALGTNVTPTQAILRAAQRTAGTSDPGPLPVAQIQALKTPQGVFDASGGMAGSPAAPQPDMTGFRPGQQAGAPPGAPTSPIQASQATPAASPLGVPAGGAQGAQASPGGASNGYPQLPGTGLAGTLPVPTGGLAYAQRAFASRFPMANAPTPDELNSAVDGLHSDGMVAEADAAAAKAGMTLHPQFAGHIADRVAVARGLPSLLSRPVSSQAASQATAEVSSLQGQPASAAPFGTDASGAPILNPTAYAGAKTAYQTHAATMGALATSPAEKAAISTIATEPTAAGKQAVLDLYRVQNPGADLSRFTPKLMTGR